MIWRFHEIFPALIPWRKTSPPFSESPGVENVQNGDEFVICTFFTHFWPTLTEFRHHSSESTEFFSSRNFPILAPNCYFHVILHWTSDCKLYFGHFLHFFRQKLHKIKSNTSWNWPIYVQYMITNHTESIFCTFSGENSTRTSQTLSKAGQDI